MHVINMINTVFDECVYAWKTVLITQSFVKPDRYVTEPKQSDFFEHVLNYLVQIQRITYPVCLRAGNEYFRKLR